MTGIGRLLKEERLKKGLTQQEFSNDIITVSYYSKIEKELHSITIEILLELLQKNNIDISTFFNKLDVEKDGNKYLNTILSQVSDAYLRKDISFLSELLDDIKLGTNDNKKDTQLVLSIIELTRASILEDLDSISPEIRELLQNKVFNLLSWDKFKLSLYSQIVELYDIESNIIMINSILSKNISFYPFENKIYILTILLNFISICIENDQCPIALGYIKIIDNEPTCPENFFQKMLNRYFYLLILNKLDQKIDENELNSIYKVVNISGMDMYSQTLKDFFEKNKK